MIRFKTQSLHGYSAQLLSLFRERLFWRVQLYGLGPRLKFFYCSFMDILSSIYSIKFDQYFHISIVKFHLGESIFWILRKKGKVKYRCILMERNAYLSMSKCLNEQCVAYCFIKVISFASVHFISLFLMLNSYPYILERFDIELIDDCDLNLDLIRLFYNLASCFIFDICLLISFAFSSFSVFFFVSSVKRCSRDLILSLSCYLYYLKVSIFS